MPTYTTLEVRAEKCQGSNHTEQSWVMPRGYPEFGYPEIPRGLPKVLDNKKTIFN